MSGLECSACDVLLWCIVLQVCEVLHGISENMPAIKERECAACLHPSTAQVGDSFPTWTSHTWVCHTWFTDCLQGTACHGSAESTRRGCDAGQRSASRDARGEHLPYHCGLIGVNSEAAPACISVVKLKPHGQEHSMSTVGMGCLLVILI